MLFRSCATSVVRSLFVLVLAMAFVARPAAGDAPNPEAVRRAEGGDVDAQLYLGLAYMVGRGVPEDPTLAAKWLGMAADQGNPLAQHTLGMLFQWGKGVTKNEATAVMWFTRAAEQDVAGAQESSGRCIATAAASHPILSKRTSGSCSPRRV